MAVYKHFHSLRSTRRNLDHSFWHQKWQLNHIGFHETTPHRFLTENIDCLGPANGQLFVPLCGKSVDMLWLAKQGYKVLGIEISEIAIKDFFHESGLHPQQFLEGSFLVWRAENITILQGDFFDLRSEHLKDCTAWYDRAALIALPHAIRKDYAEHLIRLQGDDKPGLVIGLIYPQHQKTGPPFSVEIDEVEGLFPKQRVDLIASEDVLSAHPHFEKNGMTQLQEYVVSMTPN